MSLLPRHLSVVIPLALVACREVKVAIYEIPKEIDPPSAQFSSPQDSGMAADKGAFAQAEGAELEWTAPTEWKTRQASSMRRGSYAVGADEKTAADLAITAFPGDVGGDLANVNRWLNQLSPTTGFCLSIGRFDHNYHRG